MASFPEYYQDTYLSRISPNMDIPTYARAMVNTTPQWMHGLFHLHDVTSKPIGEKQQLYPYLTRDPKPGDKIGPFPITQIDPDKIECIRQDKNLAFHSIYQLQTLPSGDRFIRCTTRVVFKNKRGKAYFQLLLKPFHHLLLPKLMGEISGTPPLHLAN